MRENKVYRIDGIKWWVNPKVLSGMPTPLCPSHNLRLTPDSTYESEYTTDLLSCEECKKLYKIPRGFHDERKYILNKIDASNFEKMEVVDIDGELTPIIKKRVTSEDEKYFVEVKIRESKRGLQLVVYAGENEKGKNEKTQIFIDPKTKRLSFDQNDLHPNDVFLELKATFNDGSIHTMKKSTKKKKNDK